MQRYCSLARWETTAPSLSLLKLYTLFQSELFWLLFSVHSANIYTYIFFSWGLLRNSSFLKWYRSCQSHFFFCSFYHSSVGSNGLLNDFIGPVTDLCSYVLSCITTESPAFGCHLEASKKKDLTMNIYLTHMLWLMMLGTLEALIARYTCKMINSGFQMGFSFSFPAIHYYWAVII